MIDKNRRTALKAIGTSVLLASGAGTATARNGKRKGASGEGTIVDIASGDDRFETLVAALGETGLDSTLDGDRQLTVFAPTDDAFEALLDALGASKEALLAREDLGTILKYHVTSGRRYASSVVNAPQITMLNGEKLPVDGTTLNGGGLGGAEIIGTNIEANNGVVHVIDGVLLP